MLIQCVTFPSNWAFDYYPGVLLCSPRLLDLFKKKKKKNQTQKSREDLFSIVLSGDIRNSFHIASAFFLGYTVNNFKLLMSQTCLVFLLLKAEESDQNSQDQPDASSPKQSWSYRHLPQGSQDKETKTGLGLLYISAAYLSLISSYWWPRFRFHSKSKGLLKIRRSLQACLPSACLGVRAISFLHLCGDTVTLGSLVCIHVGSVPFT